MSGKIKSQHEWVAKIERMVPSTIALKLRRKTDFNYAETVNGKLIFPDADAYKFSNSTAHDEILCRSIPTLESKGGAALVRNLLGELTFRKTYGAFSEIAVYDWMSRVGIDYAPQVHRLASDVVNPNGTTSDGKFAAATQEVFFDIKGFGFVEHKIKLLKERLESAAPGNEATVQGNFAVSIDDIQLLLEEPGHSALIGDMARARTATRGTLVFTLRPRSKVSVSVSEVDPIRLAVQNRDYALRYGSQFQKNVPFMLFFMVHPWFSQGNLHQNFDGHVDKFGLEFARQTFYSFNADTAIREGMPTCDLVKLLSGIAFINVWPDPSCKGKGAEYRIYLNPHATHKLATIEFDFVKERLGANLTIEVP